MIQNFRIYIYAMEPEMNAENPSILETNIENPGNRTALLSEFHSRASL